jgi:hypothetical protein
MWYKGPLGSYACRHLREHACILSNLGAISQAATVMSVLAEFQSYEERYTWEEDYEVLIEKKNLYHPRRCLQRVCRKYGIHLEVFEGREDSAELEKKLGTRNWAGQIPSPENLTQSTTTPVPNAAIPQQIPSHENLARSTTTPVDIPQQDAPKNLNRSTKRKLRDTIESGSDDVHADFSRAEQNAADYKE